MKVESETTSNTSATAMKEPTTNLGEAEEEAHEEDVLIEDEEVEPQSAAPSLPPSVTLTTPDDAEEGAITDEPMQVSSLDSPVTGSLIEHFHSIEQQQSNKDSGDASLVSETSLEEQRNEYYAKQHLSAATTSNALNLTSQLSGGSSSAISGAADLLDKSTEVVESSVVAVVGNNEIPMDAQTETQNDAMQVDEPMILNKPNTPAPGFTEDVNIDGDDEPTIQASATEVEKAAEADADAPPADEGDLPVAADPALVPSSIVDPTSSSSSVEQHGNSNAIPAVDETSQTAEMTLAAIAAAGPTSGEPSSSDVNADNWEVDVDIDIDAPSDQQRRKRTHDSIAGGGGGGEAEAADEDVDIAENDIQEYEHSAKRAKLTDTSSELLSEQPIVDLLPPPITITPAAT